ncbi:hypothetical protein [Streptomyces clavuligerus]|uniref:hypothetical protein n=1 Tax=Streptomyces clavuligerus TaxID=1901 RepID=UPI00017FF5DB|nr:hypothetical protein [Streptomyces clavuligerus]EDY49204.1 hypothetical protein SSCG_02232 [Streptomyces clavuligerus]WDN56118.1 hypothetical protein LL058_30120 [Streptomyces clavuligerus]
MTDINPPDELVGLQRAVLAARAEATTGEHSAKAWTRWQKAAEETQSAITAYAAERGLNRYDLEMAVKKRAAEE